MVVVQHPVLICDTAVCRLWYKKDDKFNVPRGWLLACLILVTVCLMNSIVAALLPSVIEHVCYYRYTLALVGSDILKCGIILHNYHVTVQGIFVYFFDFYFLFLKKLCFLHPIIPWQHGLLVCTASESITHMPHWRHCMTACGVKLSGFLCVLCICCFHDK